MIDKSLIAVQKVLKEGDSIFYMQKKEPTAENTLGIAYSIEKTKDYKLEYTEETLLETIDNLINKFPRGEQHFDYSFDNINFNDKKVAERCKRGVANTEWKNKARYYKGISEFDAPFFAIECGDKYGLFVHPDFIDYGYTL